MPRPRPVSPALAALASLLATLAVSCAPAERAVAPLRPKVLLIGIDGVRPDVLAEVPTPNLDSLAASGAFTSGAHTGMPSVSGPGWSSMLTGVWPDKHGVVDNDFTGKRYDTYPDFLTRIEQIRPELNTFAVVDWKPLGEAPDGLATLSDRVDVKHVLDGYELGWVPADDSSVALAEDHLVHGDPDALFVYLGNPDEVSHEHHSIGAEYREALALADAQVGRLVGAVRARPTYAEEDWLILVSTDHGRTADGDHGGATPEELTIFYLASGSAAAVGVLPGSVAIVDVPVTALAHLGLKADPAWGLDGKAAGLRR